MTEFDDLLDRAMDATPGDRIEFRDQIAAHGTDAISSMVDWLEDSRLGSFAVRVLASVAAQPGNRDTVLGALQEVDSNRLSAHVARDVAELVGKIRLSINPGPVSRRAAGGAKTEQWPGSKQATDLELRFQEAMLEIFRHAGEATRRTRPDGTVERGYWANRFLQAVRNHGGPEYARILLRRRGTTEGFARLKDEGRLDLTMEALVLKPEFAALFTEEERRTAADRLRAAGNSPP